MRKIAPHSRELTRFYVNPYTAQSREDKSHQAVSVIKAKCSVDLGNNTELLLT